MTIPFNVKSRVIIRHELHQVSGCKITRRIVEEHVFRTRVACVNSATARAGMPIVDGCIKLKSGICTRPCGVGNLIPQLGRLDSLAHFPIGPLDEIPVGIFVDRSHEVVGNTYRIVAILTRNGPIRFGLPIHIVFIEFNARDTLLSQLQNVEYKRGQHVPFWLR